MSSSSSESCSDSEGEGLCDYERKRLENIRKNQALLRSLGLPVKTQQKNKKKKQQCHNHKRRRGRGEESSDEEEWQPWMENRETRRKLRGRAATQSKLPPLDSASRRQILSTVTAQVDQHLKAVLDADRNGQKPPPLKKPRTSKPPNTHPAPTNPSIELPDFFNGESDGEDFYGFPIEVVQQDFAMNSVCYPVAPDDLFGSEEEDDFQGFTKEELLHTPVPTEFLHRYPKRTRGRKHYEEPELSDEDEYLFCDDCGTPYHGDCPIHGPLRTLDESSGFDDDSKRYTNLPVPAELTVKTSGIPNAGCGVFAKQFIPKGARVGPYEGKIVLKEDVDAATDTSYMWEIRRDGQKAYYVDGREEVNSHWLRFVNCARNEEEQNMVAYQYCGQIYYRTFKHIYPGNELLVWYGEDYARELGISTEFDMAPTFTCKGCGMSFVENSSFQLHLKHSEKCAAANPQIFKCGKCLQTFCELHQLQHHIRRHEQVKEQRPLEQIENYQTKQPKQLHSGKQKLFVCDYCGKAFSRSDNLQTHLRTHTGDKPYKCTYCGKAFSVNCSLQNHLRTHTGDTPYKCTYCGKAFNQSSALQTHLRTHTGDKPYKCTYCGKAFSVSCNLQNHLRTHTGDTPYKCTYCGKAFNQSSNLQTHLRTHTGDKPYKCTYCGKAFSDNSGFHAHLRTHTGN